MGRYICIDCGRPYELSNDQIQWFYDNNMTPPRRCPDCRAYRKKVGMSVPTELPLKQATPVAAKPPEPVHIMQVQQEPDRSFTVTATRLIPPHFYAKPMAKGNKRVHKNAVHHIFNEDGFSYCTAYSNVDHYFSEITLKGALENSECGMQLCKACIQAAQERMR